MHQCRREIITDKCHTGVQFLEILPPFFQVRGQRWKFTTPSSFFLQKNLEDATMKNRKIVIDISGMGVITISVLRSVQTASGWNYLLGRPWKTWLQQAEADHGVDADMSWSCAQDCEMWRSLRPSLVRHSSGWVGVGLINISFGRTLPIFRDQKKQKLHHGYMANQMYMKFGVAITYLTGSCQFIQQYSLGGTNNSITGESRLALLYISSL